MVLRFKMASELKVAMPTGHLRPHCQPLTAIVSGSILKIEALMRWQHHERGLIPRGLFALEAHESGLMTDKSCWVVREVCHQASRRLAARPW